MRLEAPGLRPRSRVVVVWWEWTALATIGRQTNQAKWNYTQGQRVSPSIHTNFIRKRNKSPNSTAVLHCDCSLIKVTACRWSQPQCTLVLSDPMKKINMFKGYSINTNAKIFLHWQYWIFSLRWQIHTKLDISCEQRNSKLLCVCEDTIWVVAK